jgi:hypothetical protein
MLSCCSYLNFVFPFLPAGHSEFSITNRCVGRRLAWHKNILTKWKQLEITLTKMYSLLGRKSKLSTTDNAQTNLVLRNTTVGCGFHFQHRNSEEHSDERYLRNAPFRWAQVTYIDIFIKTVSRFQKLVRMDRYTVTEIGDLISRFIFVYF